MADQSSYSSLPIEEFEDIPFEELPLAELGIEELESRLQLIGPEATNIDVEVVVSVSW